MKSGEVYRPGETMMIGWMVVQVRKEAGGQMSLWEPDFLSVPIAFREGVTRTLGDMRLQQSVAESFKCQPVFPNIRQSVVICSALKTEGLGVAARLEGEGTDSGWSLGCPLGEHDQNSDSELSLDSLYSVCLSVPMISLLSRFHRVGVFCSMRPERGSCRMG